MSDTARADKWMWAVRLFKTRGLAADACASGKVRRLGHPVKAATALREGDLIEAPYPEGPGHRLLRVRQLHEKRVGAAGAAAAYADETPQSELNARIFWQDQRDQTLRGRPTKKDRRAIQQFRGDFD